MMELLIFFIRAASQVTGVQIGQMYNKIGLFVDNVILVQRNPTIFLPLVQELLMFFGVVSYYKINAAKSHILGIHIT